MRNPFTNIFCKSFLCLSVLGMSSPRDKFVIDELQFRN